MKRTLLTLIICLSSLLSINAMSYEQAREQALFLTDKMAYELNLTQEQYEAAYEINLDYLLGVTTVDDLYAESWRRRNLDLSYVMHDWQYSAFQAASYFFRPLTWGGGAWHFGVYAHYPQRTFFYFDRPACYVTYRGGHSWGHNGGISWYAGRSDHFRAVPALGGRFVGMRDGWRGGDPRGGWHDGGPRGGGNFHGNVIVQNNIHINNGNRGNHPAAYGNRPSSTRTTVQRPVGGSFGNGSFGNGMRDNGFNNGSSRPNNNVNNATRPNNFGGSSRPNNFGSNSSRPSNFGSAPSNSGRGNIGGGPSMGGGSGRGSNGGGRR